MTDLQDVTEEWSELCEMANYVLAHAWNPTGEFYRAGEFLDSLIGVSMLADSGNLALIATAFPALGITVNIYKEAENGVDILRILARTAGYSRPRIPPTPDRPHGFIRDLQTGSGCLCGSVLDDPIHMG